MNYNHLHYFNVIAREGSIAKASRLLHVSQPTLSEQLKQLEVSLGERLFDRSSGALKLNAHGQRALKFTEQMFELGDRLKESFESTLRPAKARVEIGLVASAVCAMTHNQLIKLFSSTQAVVRVRQGDSQALLHELFTSGLDILITDTVPNTAKEKGLTSRCVTSPTLVVVAPAQMAASLTEPTPASLHHQPFIHHTSLSSYRWEIDQHLRQHGVEPDVVAETDDVYVVREAVRRGVGFGVIPRSVLPDDDDRVRVVYEIGAPIRVHALYVERDPTEETLSALDTLCQSQ